MAISTGYSLLRRTLGQRLNYWGGDIQNNGPGTLSANGTATTAIDTTRAEPDDEWDEAWIVLNPGSTNQAGAPTVWRRLSADVGWVQSTGTMTLQGTWPSPYNNGPLAGTPYELYKVFRPENWLQAINWALARSYPHRHVPVNFEVPQDPNSRIIQWGNLVNNLQLSNPATPPVVTEVANGQGMYQPGSYVFGYTFYNDLGETLVSPTTSITVVGTNSQVQFNAISGIPAAVLGVNYYSTVNPNDSSQQLSQLQIGSGTIPSNSPINQKIGLELNGTVVATTFGNPQSGYGSFPPIYNTTNVDVQELHHVLQRINPGAFPEIWNDLGSDLYKPLGGKTVMLMYAPLLNLSLRFVCTAVVPLMSKELDVTDEPPEMIYAGAEAYLWNLLVKTSTIVGTNWADLAKASLAVFEDLKDQYALDTPRDIAYKPIIRTQY